MVKSLRSTTLRFTFVGLSYFIVAYLGLQLASINPSATPIWPATGLAIASVLLWGYGVAPAILVAAFVVNYLTGGFFGPSVLIALGNTLEATVTVYFVSLWAGGSRAFESAAEVGKFALISAITTMISATIGVGSLVLSGLAEVHHAASVWLTWWLGDFAGAVVIAPVVLLWFGGDAWKSGANKPWQTDILYLAAIAVGTIAFSPLVPPTALRDPLGFLVVAPLIWAALLHGPRDTATVAAILAGFAVWGTLMHVGPFARTSLNESFLLLLMFMIITAIPSLALSADITARQRAQAHQALLLRELSHRVGNTLAVLISVFRRSARHARSVAELEEGFQGRLMNLAATHRLLGEANWESALVLDLVRTAVEPYCPPEYDGCEYLGSDLHVPNSIVTSLTMVLHELAMNAAKHGALKSKDGKLRVTWREEPDASGAKSLNVTWEEASCLIESAPGSTGYGTALIDTTIATLGGKIERQYEDGVFRAELVLPMSTWRDKPTF
jgi:two-component sensor histidine kinase/integral membrane sensor domain MASE1